MDTGLLTSVITWSAYLSAIAAILTFITGILFFTDGGAFGKINDIASIFQMLFMLPLAFGLYHLLPSSARTFGLIAALIGVGGVLVAAYGQTLLVFGKIDFQTSMKYFPAGAAIGVWLVLTCTFAYSSGLFSNGLTWVGLLTGAAYIATVLTFLIKGQQNTLFYVSGIVLGISYPIWAIWLGYILGSGVPLSGAG